MQQANMQYLSYHPHEGQQSLQQQQSQQSPPGGGGGPGSYSMCGISFFQPSPVAPSPSAQAAPSYVYPQPQCSSNMCGIGWGFSPARQDNYPSDNTNIANYSGDTSNYGYPNQNYDITNQSQEQQSTPMFY
jgi:hypothetical protein